MHTFKGHRDSLGLLFRVDEPVPVIHFHFSYKKRKDNFVFQIKNRIFANGIIKLLYNEVPNRNTKL